MPAVQITMAEGRTQEQKRAVAKRVTDVLVEELGVAPDAITVYIYELGRDQIAKSGVFLSETT
ncbi:2-hydroxymuconate tautomerase [uncultured Methanospirillum sp.]|uniref:2-hydroxymuconate tautomerase n=1 Tax=uncultured Methanospirillum sp. TaxID=262503 RepID=UPI0029C9247A|nr:2-hydroxymuconate tautomerase [uncultured Methanospirillum sp.]